MASAGIAGGGVLKLKTAMSAACIVLLLLMAMGPPPAMADLTDDCRAVCSPKCAGYTNDLCSSLIRVFPALGPLSLTCVVRVYGACVTACITICTANTLPPTGSPPETPETPEPVPETPETPEPVPETPETPEPVPETPETPEPVPETPETPEPVPETPETPEPEPETPETPERPQN